MLRASVTEIPDGGTFTLSLADPANPGYLYFLFAAYSDRVPGVAVATFDPLDTRYFPLNQDLLFDFVFTFPGNPFFNAFQGSLDASGNATATVLLPRKVFDGMPLDFAYVTLDPSCVDPIASSEGLHRRTERSTPTE